MVLITTEFYYYSSYHYLDTITIIVIVVIPIAFTTATTLGESRRILSGGFSQIRGTSYPP